MLTDMRHKLSFENRLIRFILFDLLLGFQLAELNWPEAIYAVTGGAAIYLLATSIVGYCLGHSATVLMTQKKQISN